MWIFRMCWKPALLDCPRQDCSSAWTTTTTMSTMSTTTAMTTRTTTRRTTTAAASCFLLVVGSKGESWCFSDGISGVVTSGADRSHSGLQICHPQPARPCAWPRIWRKSLPRSLPARCTLQVKQRPDFVRKRISIRSTSCIGVTTISLKVNRRNTARI